MTGKLVSLLTTELGVLYSCLPKLMPLLLPKSDPEIPQLRPCAGSAWIVVVTVKDDFRCAEYTFLHAQLNSSRKCHLLEAFVNTFEKLYLQILLKKSRLLIWQIDFSPAIIQSLFLNSMTGGRIHLQCLEMWKPMKLQHWRIARLCDSVHFPCVALGGSLKCLWF